MRKETTKRGFLLGLLVGLVMLIGSSQAMAYTLVASFSSSTGDTVNGYTLLGNGDDDLLYLSTPLSFWAKYEDNHGTWTWSGDDTAFSVNTTGGSWTALTGDLPQYVLFKGGSINPNSGSGGYVYLYKLEGNEPANFTMTWTYATVADPANYVLPDDPGLSHVSFYNRTTVPIPGAVWLLGSGLSALLVARRRRKRN